MSKRQVKQRPGDSTTVRRLFVPIYGATVWIIVADNAAGARLESRWKRVFGQCRDVYRFSDLCSWNGGSQFAIFFSRGSLSVEVLAHEVFHLTMHIAQWWNLEHSTAKHEATAALHGWLVEEVAKKIGVTWRIA